MGWGWDELDMLYKQRLIGTCVGTYMRNPSKLISIMQVVLLVDLSDSYFLQGCELICVKKTFEDHEMAYSSYQDLFDFIIFRTRQNLILSIPGWRPLLHYIDGVT